MHFHPLTHLISDPVELGTLFVPVAPSICLPTHARTRLHRAQPVLPEVPAPADRRVHVALSVLIEAAARARADPAVAAARTAVPPAPAAPAAHGPVIGRGGGRVGGGGLKQADKAEDEDEGEWQHGGVGWSCGDGRSPLGRRHLQEKERWKCSGLRVIL